MPCVLSGLLFMSFPRIVYTNRGTHLVIVFQAHSQIHIALSDFFFHPCSTLLLPFVLKQNQFFTLDRCTGSPLPAFFYALFSPPPPSVFLFFNPSLFSDPSLQILPQCEAGSRASAVTYSVFLFVLTMITQKLFFIPPTPPPHPLWGPVFLHLTLLVLKCQCPCPCTTSTYVIQVRVRMNLLQLLLRVCNDRETQ